LNHSQFIAPNDEDVFTAPEFFPNEASFFES